MNTLNRTLFLLNEKGFTLIEILIGMVILGSIMTGILFFALDISRSQIFLGESLESEEDIKQALEIIVPEIRSMAVSNNGSYPVVAASSSSFSFFSDINGDNLVENIRYFWDNGEFKKGVIVPTLNPVVYDSANEKIIALASDVISEDIFYYYGGDYDGSQVPLVAPIDVSKVRLIKIELTVDRNSLTPPLPVKIGIFADIRNLRGL